MLRTQCASCAVQIPLTAPRCGVCKTRYCGRDCQKTHWKGGHKELCPVIKRRGGPEEIYADKNYKEAVVAAVEKCADATKGQTCYICTQALHWKTKEGLVRGCACRGTAGFVHVSCLAEQAKILVAEAEENNLGDKVLHERWVRWATCSLCKQRYHGVVQCALGWGCWKTYVGRPEVEEVRGFAMGQLGNGLSAAGHRADALSVGEAQLAMMRRLGATEGTILVVQNNLACTYTSIGQLDRALHLRQEVYSAHLRLSGEEHPQTLTAANNYAHCLVSLQRFEEAKSLFRKIMPVARRVLGQDIDLTLKTRWMYAVALYRATGATLDDLREAVTTLEDAERIARRVLGGAHPLTADIERALQHSREVLRARDTPGST